VILRRLLPCVLALGALAAQAQEFGLPFAGRWFVMQGGDTPNVNAHMAVRAQAFGLDFMKVGLPADRALTRTNPPKAEDFYSSGEAVLSPVDGEVIAAVDGLPDNPLGTKDPANPAGNHVVIKAAPERFVFVAHFRQGTVAVKAGERVKRGQALGKCGNSGNSDAPHIHMHVQDTPELNKGTGQNIVFSGIDVELSGKRFENVSWPLIRGLFVSNR
jgi:Peptidase family M23